MVIGNRFSFRPDFLPSSTSFTISLWLLETLVSPSVWKRCCGSGGPEIFMRRVKWDSETWRMRKGRKERSGWIGEREGGFNVCVHKSDSRQVGPLTSQSIWPQSRRDSGHAQAPNLTLSNLQNTHTQPASVEYLNLKLVALNSSRSQLISFFCLSQSVSPKSFTVCFYLFKPSKTDSSEAVMLNRVTMINQQANLLALISSILGD